MFKEIEEETINQIQEENEEIIQEIIDDTNYKENYESKIDENLITFANLIEEYEDEFIKFDKLIIIKQCN